MLSREPAFVQSSFVILQKLIHRRDRPRWRASRRRAHRRCAAPRRARQCRAPLRSARRSSRHGGAGRIPAAWSREGCSGSTRCRRVGHALAPRYVARVDLVGRCIPRLAGGRHRARARSRPMGARQRAIRAPAREHRPVSGSSCGSDKQTGAALAAGACDPEAILRSGQDRMWRDEAGGAIAANTEQVTWSASQSGKRRRSRPLSARHLALSSLLFSATCRPRRGYEVRNGTR